MIVSKEVTFNQPLQTNNCIDLIIIEEMVIIALVKFGKSLIWDGTFGDRIQ